MGMLDDIAVHITANVGTLTSGINLFAYKMPDEPQDAVGLYEESGRPPAYVYNTALPAIEMPDLQIIVRSSTTATGRTLSETLWRLMQAVMNQTINGIYYQAILAVGSPMLLERDSNDKPLFSMNFNVWRVPV